MLGGFRIDSEYFVHEIAIWNGDPSVILLPRLLPYPVGTPLAI